ncbi:PEGA domain-containing protein [Bacteroides cellulosilyticus]|uniref:PEGA domain-containing protein n=1 Tax=Bacteroides cellulosilyticus TaxID=246787 RepID=UPI001D0714D1|nr:PEGA domain-containing protein [Bacteroides cellulosilyticus]MCB6270725.1 PEGA domain-containing protein [Bacteroides cellulosilyticus]MCG4970766.1 PEGA domain-containing protein [Bacteroides cellulosilyticus]
MTNRKVTKCLSIKLLLVISLFFVATATEAQNKIQVTSFNRMETDVTARITAPQRDQNGEVCALIRIVTTEKDLMFEPDALGIVSRENKPGEIWLYIPRGARRISIMHDKFGVLRNYFYPDIIEKATVYEMEIQIGDGTQQTPTNTNTQLIVMRPDPATADIYIDDEKVPTENGLFTATMKKGTHTYRVESPMYAPEAGIIDLGSEQKIMSVTLKPRFGYLEIFSLPEQDAKVFINNELAGQTPYKSDRMPLQEYRIRIEKDFFFPMDSTVTIFAGKTSSLTFKMKSTIKPKEPRRTLVMAEVGYHPSQISFGAMVGIVSKNGAYLRFRSDFGSASTELECDDTGALDNGTGTPYYKEGVTTKARMSITAGYLRQIIKPLYAYIGAGYGNRVLAWETIDGELVKNTDHSATGVAAELGAIGRLGQFAVSVGFQTVNFKYHELSAGIGFFF